MRAASSMRSLACPSCDCIWSIMDFCESPATRHQVDQNSATEGGEIGDVFGGHDHMKVT